MKNTIKKFMLAQLVFILALVSCQKNPNHVKDDIIGCWKRNKEVSYPTYDMSKCDSKVWEFAHFRDELIFDANGTGKYLVLSPIDAHFLADMTWTFDETTQILTIEKAVPESYDLIEVTENSLILKRR